MDYGVLAYSCIVAAAKGIDYTAAVNLQVGLVQLGSLEACGVLGNVVVGVVFVICLREIDSVVVISYILVIVVAIATGIEGTDINGI